MARNWMTDLSDEAIADQIERAKAQAIAEEKAGPCARDVEYDSVRDLIVFHFTNGSQLAIPPDLIQGLESATEEQLNDVWLDRAGLSVHWPSLDADFSVIGLLQGIFGTKAWMAEIGRRGGERTSEAKKRASRENGKKGGRPKRQSDENSPLSSRQSKLPKIKILKMSEVELGSPDKLSRKRKRTKTSQKNV